LYRSSDSLALPALRALAESRFCRQQKGIPSSCLELPQEPQIAAQKQANVIDAVPHHGQAGQQLYGGVRAAQLAAAHAQSVAGDQPHGAGSVQQLRRAFNGAGLFAELLKISARRLYAKVDYFRVAEGSDCGSMHV
jgi:hypothetical protein